MQNNNKNSRWKLKKSHVTKLIFIVLIVLIVFQIMYLFFKEKDECDSLDGCQVQEIEESFSHCLDLESESIVNFCLLENEQCDLITDSFQRYNCMRMIQRPHMWAFISNPTTLKFDSKSLKGNCKNENDFETFKCIVSQALIEKNDSLSWEVCSKFNQISLQGECQYFLMIKYISTLELKTRSKIVQINKQCNLIKYLNWKSECFYLLADELTLLSDYTNYLNEINVACDDSTNVVDYSCYSHVVFNMELVDIQDFCSILSQKYLPECYRGYGHKIGSVLEFWQIPQITIECEKLEQDKQIKSCIEGLISTREISVPTDLRKYKGLCYNIKLKYKSTCYELFGKALMTIIDQDDFYDSTYSFECETVPEDYKEECYFGFALSLDQMTKSNIDEAIEICNLINEEYSLICFKTLISQLNRYSHYGYESNELLCSKFSEILYDECMVSV
jgi:hypothetical protein